MWETPPPPGALPVFHCAAHKLPGDRLVGSPVILRRISVTAIVYLAGAEQLPALARLEAAARVEEAVANLGGLFNLVDVTDTAGRYAPPEPKSAPTPDPPRGQVPPLTD